MSSQDVIELDSSDDDYQPSRPPKAVAKKRQKRPMLNAMVHIPTGKGLSKGPKLGIPTITNIRGSGKIGAITVKSNKTLGLINGSKLPNVTIKPIKPLPTTTGIKVMNPYSNNTNGKIPVVSKLNKGPINVSNRPVNIQNPGVLKVAPGLSIHPSLSHIMQKMSPHVKMAIESKMTPQQKLALQQKKTPHKGALKLPPGITVKKTYPGQVMKRPANTPTIPTPVPKKVRRERPQPVTVETVELDADDDDEEQPKPSSSSVQWYVRPEDDIKEQNETEPEQPKIFEITIEDSPSKPIINKRTCEVEKEISISIEDSPVKPPDENGKDKQADIDSDDEPSKTPKTPSSRKKLNYPQGSETQSFNEKTIEIEIEPYCSDPLADNVVEKPQEQPEHLIIEIQESPVRKKRKLSPDVTPKKSRPVIADKPANADKPAKVDKPADKPAKVDKPAGKPAKVDKPADKPAKVDKPAAKPAMVEKPAVKPAMVDKTAVNTNQNIIILNDEEYKDFHPVYKSFIQLCFKLDSTEDMQKIVEKKIKNYYLQVPQDFTDSEEFVELVSGKMDLMKASPDKMFLYIKDVVDELNIQRKLARQPGYAKEKEKEKEAPAPPLEFEDSELDVKRRRQIRKLEKTLKKLHRAINKLEEQEVDFDDDGDSVYILTERYKERLIRVHAKLCQLSNVKMPSEPRVSIDARPGQPAGPAKRLERWINRRVPIGTPLPFPDFHDVLRCVKEANKDDDLGWNDVDVMEEARDLFTRCGKKLQRRRQENEWRVAASRLTADADPAELSDALKRKLDDNRRAALSKETDLINKYADRQKQLKLEAVEIGDQEAEESPVESEDEANDADDDADAKLDNSQERKKRLKRLLKKKNNTSENTNEQIKEVQEDDVEMAELPKDSSLPKEDEKVAEVEPDNNKTAKSERKESDAKDNEMDVDVIEKEDTNNEKSDKIEITVENDKDKTTEDDKEKATEDDKENTTEDDKEKSVKTKDRQQSVETLSDDDSQKIDSDIDELHLLQKLHSDEVNSLESSDSESLIAISDSMESGDEKDKKHSSDVVSIENSSSESEQEEQADEDEVEAIQDEENNEDGEDPIALEIDSNDDKEKTDNPTPNEYKDYQDSLLGPVLLGSSCETSNEATDLDNPALDDIEKDETYTSTNLKDDALSIGDTLVEEAIESTNNEEPKESTNNEEVDSSSKSIDIVNKDLNEEESPPISCQKEIESNSESVKANEAPTETADSPINCDSESNEAISNDKNDEIDNKKLDEVEDISVVQLNNIEASKVNKSVQPADSPIDCDQDSQTSETKIFKTTASAENITIIFEPDISNHDEVNSSVAMDADIATKEIEIEIPEKEISLEVGKKELNKDSNNTDVQVDSNLMEVYISSKEIVDETANEPPKEVEGKEDVGCIEEK